VPQPQLTFAIFPKGEEAAVSGEHHAVPLTCRRGVVEVGDRVSWSRRHHNLVRLFFESSWCTGRDCRYLAGQVWDWAWDKLLTARIVAHVITQQAAEIPERRLVLW
jgi:hypothetical protein